MYIPLKYIGTVALNKEQCCNHIALDGVLETVFVVYKRDEGFLNGF